MFEYLLGGFTSVDIFDFPNHPEHLIGILRFFTLVVETVGTEIDDAYSAASAIILRRTADVACVNPPLAQKTLVKKPSPPKMLKKVTFFYINSNQHLVYFFQMVEIFLCILNVFISVNNVPKSLLTLASDNFWIIVWIMPKIIKAHSNKIARLKPSLVKYDFLPVLTSFAASFVISKTSIFTKKQDG